MITRRTLAAVAVALMAGTSASALAADYPVSTIRLFVPANPGGSTDANARVLARFIEEHSNATVAIVNQAAGGGVVAAQTTVASPPDGSVLYLWHAAVHTTNLFGQSPFPYTAFTPLATTAEFNDVYAVRADAPFSTLEELIDYAAANPNTLTIGSQLGGTTQIKGSAINAAAGGNMRIVDAGGESDRITALLGGQVDIISMSVANAQQYVEDGQLVALAVMNRNPDPFAPDWPTTISQGIDISFPLIFTLYGPPNMPEDVVAAIDALITEIGEDEAFHAALASISQVPAVRTSAETAEFLAEELAFVETMVNP